jgi:hypothetical protein
MTHNFSIYDRPYHVYLMGGRPVVIRNWLLFFRHRLLFRHWFVKCGLDHWYHHTHPLHSFIRPHFVVLEVEIINTVYQLNSLF